MQEGRQKVKSITSSLSDRCKDIILGSLLGDGSLKLHRPYRNARFSFRHAATNRDYFLWKVEQVKEISAACEVWEQSGPDGGGGDKLRYQSAAVPALTELYHLTHPHGKFRIRRKWLNRLTPLSLCVWWLDDGSLLNGKQGVLCTDGFSHDELLIVVRYFRKVWGLDPRIGRVSQKGPRAKQYRLWFRSRENLIKFLRIVLPHVPVPSMLRKVMLLYNDPDLQQRWISEVSAATGFPSAVVEGVAVELKGRLSRFRE